MKFRRALFWILNIVLPLCIGLCVYLWFRPDTYVSRFLLRFLPIRPPQLSCAFLRNHLCDMLWAYALCFCIVFILGHSRKNAAAALVICVGFSFLMELIQKKSVFPGTFDPLDVVLSSVSAILALLFIVIIHYYGGQKNEKSCN